MLPLLSDNPMKSSLHLPHVLWLHPIPQTRTQQVCVGSTCINAVNIEVIPPEETEKSVVTFL